MPFGAFRRSLFDQLGGFDESLETNEDYEFNTRIRLMGGKLWLNPEIKVKYFARPTLGQLAKQYWRYGFWKVKMLKRYPASLRWRASTIKRSISRFITPRRRWAGATTAWPTSITGSPGWPDNAQ